MTFTLDSNHGFTWSLGRESLFFVPQSLTYTWITGIDPELKIWEFYLLLGHICTSNALQTGQDLAHQYPQHNDKAQLSQTTLSSPFLLAAPQTTGTPKPAQNYRSLTKSTLYLLLSNKTNATYPAFSASLLWRDFYMLHLRHSGSLQNVSGSNGKRKECYHLITSGILFPSKYSIPAYISVFYFKIPFPPSQQ